MARDTKKDTGRAKIDDDELFEREMEQLGTKRSARAAARPEKPRPAGVTVSEDLDFDALMRASAGPAKEMPHGPPGADERAVGVSAKEGAAAGASAGGGASARVGASASASATAAKAIERGRYAPTAEESRQFLAAMSELGPVPDRAEPGKARAAATRTGDDEEELARALKRGDIESDATLDLHHRTQKEARPRLQAFLEEGRTERWRVVTIIVGKGHHSDRGEAVLRPLVERWLREDFRELVREVHQAPPYLGGAGAWVALLR